MCSSHRCPSPEVFTFLNWNSAPDKHWFPVLPPHPRPLPLASTTVLSDSLNLTILGNSYKWNQTVFVCTYCILECIFNVNLIYIPDFPGSTVVKNPLANVGNARDVGLILGSGRSLGGGNGNPLQYSCLGNSMHWGAWQATVHRGRKESHTTKRINTR